MHFNFRGVYISRIYNFRIFRVFKFVVVGYSGVEIFADIQSESYTIIVYGSCRGAKLAGLVVGFVWRCHCIKWWAASDDFTSTRRYGHLSLEKGLVAPAKATEKIREDPFAIAMKRVTKTVGHVLRTILCICILFLRQRVSIPVKLQEAATKRWLIAILVTHDVID